MTELDNNKLEKDVTKLFLQALSINHSYYCTNQRKLNLFAEFYIYSHFFYEYVLYKETKKKLFSDTDKETKNILEKLNSIKIKSSEDFDYIKETLNQLYSISEIFMKDVTISTNDKYSKLTSSIIRKLKIKMVTK